MRDYQLGVLSEYLYWYRFVIKDVDTNWVFGQRYFHSMLNALEFVLDRSYRHGEDELHEDDDWYWRCIAQHRHNWGVVEAIIVRRKDMPDPTDFSQKHPPESPYIEAPSNPNLKCLPKLKL